MNADNFAEYLQHPARLYQVSFQELKNLVAEYPYAANVRFLLALKSRMEQDPKLDQHLHQLAAHTFDRAALYHFFQEELAAIVDLATETNERLELKDLQELENMLEAPPLTVDIGSGQSESIARPEAIPEIPRPAPSPQGTGWEATGPALAATGPEPPITPSRASQPPPVTAPALRTNWAAMGLLAAAVPLVAKWEAVRPAAVEPTPPAAEATPAPLPKKSFDSWSNRRRRDRLARIRQLREKAQPQEANNGLKLVEQVVRESIVEHDNLASETLARLLVDQGKYARAIRMYERLILLFPEKSRYFAAIIENLKQKS